MSKRGHEERAAGVLIARGRGAERRWLLLRNARLGHWGFAKGKLERGESELRGALREVREETGLAPSLAEGFAERISYLIPETAKKAEISKEVVYFLGEIDEKSQVRKSEEHDQVEWLSLADALTTLEHEQLREVLRRAARFLDVRR